MIFRQLYHLDSGTYTYLIASRHGGEALIIDPVLERVERYMQLLDELDLKLVKVIDTHVHADHITGMGALRDQTKCVTVMGQQAPVDVVSMRVDDGDVVEIEGHQLRALYTPGHTSDSYSFLMDDRVFTGDTLLIRGTGRTDFQNGDSRAQYESLFNKLLTLPDDTLVYPAHDYKGDTVSTIAEEKRYNPRLQVSSPDEYAEIMDNLNLANPKMMDVAVPANLQVGRGQKDEAHPECALPAEAIMKDCRLPECILVDLREDNERAREGLIPGSVHAPYGQLNDMVGPGGLLRELAHQPGHRLIYYCAFGERSAMAVDMSRDVGVTNVCHMIGGIAAWQEAGGAIEKP
jgi:glyoxylase-like metal-dependent hydrolase (beta-lactamase superfamily II)/rhodanese-related sulfurtransferase